MVLAWIVTTAGAGGADVDRGAARWSTSGADPVRPAPRRSTTQQAGHARHGRAGADHPGLRIPGLAGQALVHRRRASAVQRAAQRVVTVQQPVRQVEAGREREVRRSAAAERRPGSSGGSRRRARRGSAACTAGSSASSPQNGSVRSPSGGSSRISSGHRLSQAQAHIRPCGPVGDQPRSAAPRGSRWPARAARRTAAPRSAGLTSARSAAASRAAASSALQVVTYG